jgi:nucleoside-diphosphate-sugar epimerase
LSLARLRNPLRSVDAWWNMPENIEMDSGNNEAMILVTGATGHIGREVCRLLTEARWQILAVDLNQDKTQDVRACDLRLKSQVSALFQDHSVRAVIHLAGILPSAFQSDPLTGADVNLSGSLELMRQSLAADVQRFIFASSMSVYGSLHAQRLVTEDDAAAPDEVYGAAKRAVELIGKSLSEKGAFEFVALRIARVVGPGIKKTSSPWRSQIFATVPQPESIRIPFSPDAMLSLVHVEDVARMLFTLVEATEVNSFVYNTPAEIWQVKELKGLVEKLQGIRVEHGPEGAWGGPMCDGSRFAREFKFHLRQLRDHLSGRVRIDRDSHA